MTGAEAWSIISQNLDELMRYRMSLTNDKKPYTPEEISAQVTAFLALKKMDEVSE